MLASALIGVTAVMIIWTVLFLSSRLWVNRHRIQLPDIIAVLAFIVSLGFSGLILWKTKYARHQYDVPVCWLDDSYVKWTCAMQIILPFAHTLSKAAILVLLFQLFSVSKRIRIAIYIGLGATILNYGLNLIFGPLYTVPRAGETWTDLLTNGRPQHLNKVGLQQAVVAVVIDIYIFILPFPLLSTLNLGFRKRLQLFFLFSTAAGGVIASAIGLAFRVILLNTADATWVEFQIFICIMVEIYVAIIVSCLPAFANFTKTYISETSFYQSLSSLLWSHNNNSEHTGWPSKDNQLAITTIGGTKPPGSSRKTRKVGRQYSELEDTIGLNTSASWNITSQGNGTLLRNIEQNQAEVYDTGIQRTCEVDQLITEQDQRKLVSQV